MTKTRKAVSIILLCVGLTLMLGAFVSPVCSENETAVYPTVTIHATDSVRRGHTGTFVVQRSPAVAQGDLYVNYVAGGNARAGTDYVALVPPVHIGESGFGVITVETLPLPAAGILNVPNVQLAVKLVSGPGYNVGNPKSAIMWIKA